MGLWPRPTAVEHREAGVGRAPSAGLGDQQSHRLESHSQFTPFTGRVRLLASAVDREPLHCEGSIRGSTSKSQTQGLATKRFLRPKPSILGKDTQTAGPHPL